jgi:hypothetical protein
MLIVYESATDYIIKMQERAALSGRDIKYIVVSESEVSEIRNIHGPHVAKDGVYGLFLGTLLVTTAYHVARLKEDKRLL